MSESWDFYFTPMDDAIASLFVDLGIREHVPDPDRSWLLLTRLHFRQPRDDGLSSSEEAPLLNDIEDVLTPAVQESVEAELVGRITTAGHRDFYFYGPRPDGFDQAVAAAMKSFPDYKFETRSKSDPEWSLYLDILYPSPEEHQCIQNRHVIETLTKHGDSLEKPRTVSHWAYFPSPPDRNKYIAKAVSAGFQVANQSEREDADADLPHGVTLERVDPVDWQSINEVTLQLFRLAEEANGHYDGWETSVEKED